LSVDMSLRNTPNSQRYCDRRKMYQVKVFDKQTHELIMESEILDTLRQADSMIKKLGICEDFYVVGLRLNAVWSNRLVRRIRI
jgi:hypothetical protein